MNKKIIIAIIGAISLFSCSLKEDILPFVNQESFYKTEAQCRAVVNGCYIPIKSIYHSSFMLVNEACADLFWSGSTTVDSRLEVSPSKPEFGNVVWRYGYRGVDLCNEAIACIGDTPHVSDSIKNVLTAECRVMRAMYYYILTNTFNGVPFYTCQVNTHEIQDSIRYLPRTDANVIRQILYDDLKNNALPYFTEENGLKVREVEAPMLRSGYAHALMLMAKFAMWYKDWDGALEALHKLEEIYGELNEANYPLEEIKWSHKMGKETIFELQHDYDIAGVKYYGSLAKLMMPPRSSGYIFDGIYLPGYGNSIPGVNSLRANYRYAGFRTYRNGEKKITSYCASSIFGAIPVTYSDRRYIDDYPEAPNPAEQSYYYVALDMSKLKDKRALLNFGFGNWETGEAFNQVKNQGRLWPGPKFWCPNIINNYDSNNYKLFRYADAVLMMAECYCMNQDAEKAFYYINLVKERAGIETLENFYGYDELLGEIMNERARELGGEQHRKWDLVRWGIWFQKTYDFTDNTRLKANMRPCHEYYPIPDSQCALSGYILDNPTYKEYGLN